MTEIVDGSWYEAAISAYLQHDQDVSQAKWERARVAFYIVGRAHKTGDRDLLNQFASDVRRSSSHLRNEAFAFHLKAQLDGVGQPQSESLTPTYYVEAAKGMRRDLEAGDTEALSQAGELLREAEEEHMTVATMREKKNLGPRMVACPKCGEIYAAKEAQTVEVTA